MEGMDCASCAKTVEKAVAALDGVRAAQVSFGNATLTVDGDVDADQVQAVVARAGYRAHPAARRRGEPRRAVLAPRRPHRVHGRVGRPAGGRGRRALAGAPRAVAEPLYLLSMAVGGWAIARAAWRGAAAPRARHERADDARGRRRGRHRLLRRGRVGAGPVLGRHDAGGVRVRPQPPLGHRADGARARRKLACSATTAPSSWSRSRRSPSAAASSSARASASRSTATSWPAPRASTRRPSPASPCPSTRQPGATVFAGTLNAQGALTVRATKAAGDSTLARVAALVEEAQGSPRAVGALRRPLRARLHAAGVRGRARARRRARRVRRRARHVALPGAGAAHRRLPVLAGHLDPRRRRLGGRRAPPARACSSRAARRSKTSAACAPSPRQDRHAHRAAGRSSPTRRARRRSATTTRSRSSPPSSAAPSIRSPGARRAPPATAASTVAEPRGFEALPGRGVVAARRRPRRCGPAARAWPPSASARCPRRSRGCTSAGRPPSCSARATARSPCSGSPTSRARKPRPRRRRCARRRRARRHAHRRQRARRRAVAARSAPTSPRRPAARGQARAPSRSSTARPARSRWSATASTTRPRSPPRPSASRWAPPAPTPRWQSADVALMTDDLARLPDAVTGARQALARHAPERHRLARRQGGLRRARAARAGHARARRRRRHGHVAAGHAQRPAAAAPPRSADGRRRP